MFAVGGKSGLGALAVATTGIDPKQAISLMLVQFRGGQRLRRHRQAAKKMFDGHTATHTRINAILSRHHRTKSNGKVKG